MKANELRIGNYLLDENSNVKQVIKIGFTRVWIGKAEEYWEAVDYNETSSIPLTEEWLLKFGFEEEIREGNSSDFWVYHKSNLTFNSNHGWWYRNQYIDNQLKHVHQLQNLYFALTGTELTINKL